LFYSSLLALSPRPPTSLLFPYTTLFRSTYNLLGEKSRELTDNFQRSCDTSLQFEEDHSPWQLRLNLAYGLGAAAIAAIALALERSEEHTSELQSRFDLVCRLLLEKKKQH